MRILRSFSRILAYLSIIGILLGYSGIAYSQSILQPPRVYGDPEIYKFIQKYLLLNVPAEQRWYVDGGQGNDNWDCLAWDTACATITQALSLATGAVGEWIFIAPGTYDEQVTVSKAEISLVGIGPRGSISIAPTASNPTALTVTANNVSITNITVTGSGTGGGALIQGVEGFRAVSSNFTGGAFGAKLESTATAAVADTYFKDCTFAWTTTGLDIVVSGGGNPVTQTLVKESLFQNVSGDGIRAATVQTADIWVIGNIFANEEDAGEPTQYLQLDTVNTTGLVAGNFFATTVHASAKMAIATGVIYAGNFAEQEGPATGGGTSGRPD